MLYGAKFNLVSGSPGYVGDLFDLHSGLFADLPVTYREPEQAQNHLRVDLAAANQEHLNA